MGEDLVVLLRFSKLLCDLSTVRYTLSKVIIVLSFKGQLIKGINNGSIELSVRCDA
jgi:hypothetical protein